LGPLVSGLTRTDSESVLRGDRAPVFDSLVVGGGNAPALRLRSGQASRRACPEALAEGAALQSRTGIPLTCAPVTPTLKAASTRCEIDNYTSSNDLLAALVPTGIARSRSKQPCSQDRRKLAALLNGAGGGQNYAATK